MSTRRPSTPPKTGRLPKARTQPTQKPTAVLPASYVYVIFRPNGVPAYVGKGRRSRYKRHAQTARSGRGGNKHLRNIYAKADKAGLELPLIFVREGITDAEACTIEIAFIAAIGREDLGTGPLVNRTDGGEGLAGHIRSSEQKTKMGRRSKALWKTPEYLEKMKTSRGEEWKAKISKTLTGRPGGSLGKPKSPETRAKISATLTGKKLSQATCDKLKITNQANWDKPEFREKMKASQLARGLRERGGRDRRIPMRLPTFIFFRRPYPGRTPESTGD